MQKRLNLAFLNPHKLMSSSTPAPNLVSEQVTHYKVTWMNLFIPILVSFAAFGIIGWLTYRPGVFSRMVELINVWLVLASVVVVTIRVTLGGLRLRYVSHQRLTLSEALRTQVIWDFYANVTPSVTGGAPFAALYMNKDAKVPIGEASSIMMFLMLLDQIWFALSIPVMLLASLFVEVIPSSVGTLGEGLITTYFVGIMIWVGIFAYATVINPNVLIWLMGKLFSLPFLKRYKSRIELEMDSLRQRAAVIRAQPPRFFIWGVFLTFLIWVCRYVLLYVVVISIQPNVPAVTVLFRAMAVLLSYIIMPTPGGAGGVEAAYAVFMTPLIGQDYVIPTLFLWRFIGFYIFIILGAFLTARSVGQHVADKMPDAPESPA